MPCIASALAALTGRISVSWLKRRWT